MGFLTDGWDEVKVIAAERDEARKERDSLARLRDQLRAELIKVLRFVGGQAAPDVSTSVLLNVNEEVSMVLGEMAGKIATLRAEVERLQVEAADAESHAHVTVAKLTKATARAEAAERDAAALKEWWNLNPSLLQHRITAAESTVAGLRRALEEVQAMNPWKYEKAYSSFNGDPGRTVGLLIQDRVNAIITPALTASPAEHKRRIRAEALRELIAEADKRRGSIINAFGDVSAGDILEIAVEMADRLEATDGK